MAYADTSDVAKELGRSATSSAETDQWSAWLDRVERSIERRFRRAGLDLATQVADNDPTQTDVIDVEIAAVIRKIQNPVWGQSSTTVSVDDAQVTKRREGASKDADPLDLFDEEWEALLPTTIAPNGVFSLMPS